mmetsp:Transcript_21749/g.38099  ORF Transcript_21749/g.38099 Transcript_21749/m.38099 type:complete len:455 (+) Transcript_21749:41-1405(+)
MTLLDLAHLKDIGLAAPSLGTLSVQQCLAPALPEDLETHFPSSGSRSLMQKIFLVPNRPQDVSDLSSFLSWIDQRAERWPQLAGVQGGPDISAKALRQAVAVCGDLASLDQELHEVVSIIRDCFTSSDLCQALMRGANLWNVDLLSSVFRDHDVNLPKRVCGTSRYTQAKWIQEYDGKAFLSIDMREANCSALRTMAMLVDPALHKQIDRGWIPLLEGLLGAKADLVESLKPLREIVLGGLERAWLRRQPDLCGVHGMSTELEELDGATYLKCALGDQSLPDEKQTTECRTSFKKLRGRISSAYTEVEHCMIEHVASAVLSMCDLQLFATCGDEVIFVLNSQSAAEADAVAVEVSNAVQKAFAETFQDLASLFRVETFLVLDLGRDVSASGTGAMVGLTRRLLKSGKLETFLKVKGVSKEQNDKQMDVLSKRLCARRDLHSAEWEAWLGHLNSQ